MEKHTIDFVKMVGSGNDFVVIDNRDGKISDTAGFALMLCHRTRGIGADGLLLVEKSSKSDFLMRIINTDGSEAEMCGNGARCVAQYAFDTGIASSQMKFETIAGIIEASVHDHAVKLKMIDPKNLNQNFSLTLKNGETINVSFLNTGVPHVVVFVSDIETVKLKNTGSNIRYNEAFSPQGTNVNFVQVVDKHTIKIRTYERGVEDETLSCGSGSTASAIISCLEKGAQSPVYAHTKSGEVLTIYADVQKDNDKISIKNVFLEGAVKKVFEGKI